MFFSRVFFSRIVLLVLSLALSACDGEVSEINPEPSQSGSVTPEEVVEQKQVACYNGGWDEVLYEPNQDSCQAYPLAFNQVYRTALEGDSDRTDVFSLTLSSGRDYVLSLKNETSVHYSWSEKLYFKVEDALGNLLIAKTAIEANQFLNLAIDELVNGKVFITLTTSKQDFIYQLAVYSRDEQGFSQDLGTFEPNNIGELAYPVTLNQSYSSAVNHLEDKQDWFVLDNLAQGKSYRLNIHDACESYGRYDKLKLSVVDENKVSLVASETFSNDSRSILVTPVGGKKIYLVLENTSSSYTHLYNFSWSQE